MGNDVAVGHVILLGDSIFDNAAYAVGAPDVVRQVRQGLPEGSKATLAAVDGSKIRDVRQQLRRVPSDATHLVLSVGGNNALGSSDFLDAPARSAAEALSGLADIGESFERGYLAMLTDVLTHELPTAICTVYYPRFPDAAFAEGGSRGADGVQRLHRSRGVYPRSLPVGSAVDLHRGRGLCQPDRTIGAGR
jgi:hypothetical protein